MQKYVLQNLLYYEKLAVNPSKYSFFSIDKTVPMRYVIVHNTSCRKRVPFTSQNVAVVSFNTVHTSPMNIVYVKFVLLEHLTITARLILYLDKRTLSQIQAVWTDVKTMLRFKVKTLSLTYTFCFALWSKLVHILLYSNSTLQYNMRAIVLNLFYYKISVKLWTFWYTGLIRLFILRWKRYTSPTLQYFRN